MLTVDAGEGDITCEKCSKVNRFAAKWSDADRWADGVAPWLPMDATRLVNVWLHDSHRAARNPIPAELVLAERLITDKGTWWAALIEIQRWHGLGATKDRLYLTGLAQRAGYSPPNTS